MSRDPFVLVSNRAPLSFGLVDGELNARRGAGGLVSGLGPLVHGTETLWIAAAMSSADRQAAAAGVSTHEGFRTLMVDVDPGTYQASYDVACNQILWFVHHGMFDRMRTPRFDRRTEQAWEAYRTVNLAFAEATADHAPEDAKVLIQDYHLALVAPRLREVRPDLRLAHFSHTPFCTPEELAVLPDWLAVELLEGMAANDACGFHSDRWRKQFLDCCEDHGVEPPSTIVCPLGSDPDDLRSVAAGEACAVASAEISEQVGDRVVIGRVDRIEPSKNIVRGFEAFDLFLTEHPEWHERVCFVASIYPSRGNLATYQAYRQEVEARVRLVNEGHGSDSWTPVLLDTDDHFPTSVAVLRRADVLLVNPVRDGLNLVAKEVSLVNEHNAVLLLSPGAGIFDELADVAIEVHPIDIGATADAIAAALALGDDDRRQRFEALYERATRRTAVDWLDEQLAALD